MTRVHVADMLHAWSFPASFATEMTADVLGLERTLARATARSNEVHATLLAQTDESAW